LLFLLSKGADPTTSVEGLANTLKLTKKPEIISMGEGQEEKARTAINNGNLDGRWVILNNSHLSLSYIQTMETVFKVPDNPEDDMIHKDFRLWMTCDPTNDFPLGVLQLCIKVTDEPPKGMKDGL
jgi:dynein heavy chain